MHQLTHLACDYDILHDVIPWRISFLHTFLLNFISAYLTRSKLKLGTSPHEGSSGNLAPLGMSNPGSSGRRNMRVGTCENWTDKGRSVLLENFQIPWVIFEISDVPFGGRWSQTNWFRTKLGGEMMHNPFHVIDHLFCPWGMNTTSQEFTS